MLLVKGAKHRSPLVKKFNTTAGLLYNPNIGIDIIATTILTLYG